MKSPMKNIVIINCQFLTFLGSLFYLYFIVKKPIKSLQKRLIKNPKCLELKMNSFLPKSKVGFPNMHKQENHLNL